MIPSGQNIQNSHSSRRSPIVQEHPLGGNGKYERAHHAGQVVSQPTKIAGHVDEVLGRANARGNNSRRLPASFNPFSRPGDYAAR